jgi:hypothetical protein
MDRYIVSNFEDSRCINFGMNNFYTGDIFDGGMPNVTHPHCTKGFK